MTIKQCYILLLYQCSFNAPYPPLPPPKIPHTLLNNNGPHSMVKLKIKEKPHILRCEHLGLLRNSVHSFTSLHVLPGHLTLYIT